MDREIDEHRNKPDDIIILLKD